MKRYVLPLLLVSVLSSCTKSFDCTCKITETENGVVKDEESYTTPYIGPRNHAAEQCNTGDNVDSYNIYSTITDCELD